MEFVGIENIYAESATPEQLLDKYGLLSRDVVAAVHRVLKRKQ
jgi:transketolase C-terminal domain/subunit